MQRLDKYATNDIQNGDVFKDEAQCDTWYCFMSTEFINKRFSHLFAQTDTKTDLAYGFVPEIILGRLGLYS